ncbi:KH domain-containing protein akap-1 [Cephus cinctus]|uniref:KH domain-containing protein akap-1 n=1 Tax=Cephus cinctus TaxID=211228 RepID=A0AAJ7C9M9_CEPCN|nr:KH domain-containing protein akap-1 [Cephus cinctus]XP_015605382.1 KH domain-containing protein akap-1 [Cephus cinctus]XP_015605383.1 KH domain-containing protein akap-1 [Cephus cinctus]
MSSSRLQLVKWSFPAFALVLGFLWYKRRRVDRADPGGMTKFDRNHQTKTSKGNLNLYDSGIHVDESFSLNSSSGIACEEIVCSPRRVSESLDIPTRNPTSLTISIQSGISSGDSQAWYKDVEPLPEMQEIRLGSNPKSNSVSMLSRSRPTMQPFDTIRDSTEVKLTKVFDNVTEEDESSPLHVPKSPVSGIKEDGHDLGIHMENSEKPVGTSTAVSDAKSQGRVVSERDSANHSPISGVLEGSVTDEARSEGSTDSGKGGSIKGHNNTDRNPSIYEFIVPQALVGRLIGRHGSFLQNIRTKAEVNLVIKRHPTARELKICAIEGSTDGINLALDIIKQKFPEKKFPNLNLEQVSFLQVPEQVPWASELMQLSLVEGVNNDVLVCNILKPNHLFIHLPTHPTYPSLRILDENMTQLYNTVESPPVPDELRRGMILVAKWYSRWVRIYIENPDPTGDQHLVRLVDHGGFWTFSRADMRKIRSDYLTLPFQAIEVLLAHIQPKNGEWTQEAYDLVAHICSGIVGQAQIEGYVDTITYISLYFNIQKYGVISLAEELVARGYAEPITLEDVVVEEELTVS